MDCSSRYTSPSGENNQDSDSDSVIDDGVFLSARELARKKRMVNVYDNFDYGEFTWRPTPDPNLPVYLTGHQIEAQEIPFDNPYSSESSNDSDVVFVSEEYPSTSTASAPSATSDNPSLITSTITSSSSSPCPSSSTSENSSEIDITYPSQIAVFCNKKTPFRQENAPDAGRRDRKRTFYCPDGQVLYHSRVSAKQKMCLESKFKDDAKIAGLPYVHLMTSECKSRGCDIMTPFDPHYTGANLFNHVFAPRANSGKLQDDKFTDGLWGN